MCNIREVVLQEYDLQMYKGNSLEMLCSWHTVVYMFEDAGILILVSFCTIQKKQWYSPFLAENAFRLSWERALQPQLPFQIQCSGVWSQNNNKKCVNPQILLHRTVSRPKWLLCQWLCSWLRAETADSGSWQRVKAQRGRDREPCGKRNSN